MECIYTKELNQEQKKQIFDLLCEADQEFVPPLSYRRDTTQKNLNSALEQEELPYAYYEKVILQSNILAVEEGNVVGFMSFEEESIQKIKQTTYHTIYLSTLIVQKESRRKGLANLLYKELLGRFPGKNITTRTWSTNAAHINLLGKLGFRVLVRIENDRGRGIDTIYFGRIIDEEEKINLY